MENVMENVCEDELIRQMVDGNDQAFLLLYERHVHSVHGFLMQMLRDPVLVDEVTQDTFLKLWNHAAQYRAERGTLRTWLLTIARHTALDYLRREARALPIKNEDDPQEFWQDMPDQNTLTEESRWHSLRFAVHALSEKQRQVIEMIFYQGLTQSDIAEILGWPLGTVKTRLRAALEQLRTAWAE
jgi:RNA polymerase sigma-70 factor (ECF subfamily)